jgi:hypothetical protein
MSIALDCSEGRSNGWRGFWLVAALLLATACNRADSPNVRPQTERRAETAHVPHLGHHDDDAQADAVFTNCSVLRISIEIPRAGMSALRQTPWGNGQERPVVRATVKEGDNVYTNVAVHLKGAAGSFRPVDDRPALTLNFDKLAPGQSFHGLHKISLNNSVQDPTYLSEKFARELFLAANVPVPRAGHALVHLNGHSLGLYVLLEGANKQFLKHYFKNAKGNLYDGGFCQEINDTLAINSGDNPEDHSGLRALLSVIHSRRPPFEKLSQVLDTDRFISMMVIELMIGHWDGYTLNRNNWRVFHDLEANKMVFIPHGLDQIFGTGHSYNPNEPLLPQHAAGQVARAVLNTREGEQKFWERAAQLYTNVFQAERLVQRVDFIASSVSSDLATTDPQLASQIRRQATRFEQKIAKRAEGLRHQFDVPLHPVEFTSQGSLTPSNWHSETRSGQPALAQLKDPEGANVLGIRAGPQGTSSASWRTRVVLPPGDYQLVGRVRLNGVEIEPGDTIGGVDLRISKGPPRPKLLGTLPWTDLKYPFEVQDNATPVELVCELRASKGEAFFDSGSVRIVRLP